MASWARTEEAVRANHMAALDQVRDAMQLYQSKTE